MPTFEYKYEKGRKLYWASEGVPQSETDILIKISKCTVDKISVVHEGGCQVIQYEVYGVFGTVTVNENFLFESEEKAYVQMYYRLSEQIEIDQEQINKLKNLRTLCMNKGKI